jgi:DNA invertase Pin-like site-specific DNA recombinase
MKRAALYGRVSTGEQNEGMQVREMLDSCEQRTWKPTPFLDHGVSGSKEKRPALDRMMAEVRRGKFDVVMVYKFDRFARSLRHLILALEEFQALGVEFVSVRDQVDTTTAAGRLMFQIIGAFAEFEREVIRERVKSGMANRQSTLRETGWFVSNKGHRRTSLGRPRVVADVATIRKLRDQRCSWAEISQALGVSKDTARRAFLRGAKGLNSLVV